MNITLSILIADWQDALWLELATAYERDHMDASHDIQADYLDLLRAGVDSWLSKATVWNDDIVDALRRETDFRARLVQIARDEGMDRAMLAKLAWTGDA